MSKISPEAKFAGSNYVLLRQEASALDTKMRFKNINLCQCAYMDSFKLSPSGYARFVLCHYGMPGKFTLDCVVMYSGVSWTPGIRVICLFSDGDGACHWLTSSLLKWSNENSKLFFIFFVAQLLTLQQIINRLSKTDTMTYHTSFTPTFQ